MYGWEGDGRATSVMLGWPAMVRPFDVRHIASPADPRPEAPGGSLATTLKGALAPRPFRAALPVAALVVGSQAMGDVLAVIRWRAAGLGETTRAALVAAAVCSEIVAFLLIGPRLVRRLGLAGCAALSACAGVLRWSVFAESTAIAALAVSGLPRCRRASPPRRKRSTARSASGRIHARLGGHALLTLAALCLCALPMTPGLRNARQAPS